MALCHTMATATLIRVRRKMRVAIYARVSTANNGQDPTMQTRELQEYASRRGWTVAGEYVDVGISGTKEKRPELDRLMTDAHRRRFDTVAVWKFDRFARSVSHLLRALENFQALGIEWLWFFRKAAHTSPPRKPDSRRSGRDISKEAKLADKRFQSFVHKTPTQDVMSSSATP
jgi:hypothetical protein